MNYLSLRKSTAVLFVTGILVFTAITAVAEKNTINAVDQRAITILKGASSFLSKQKQFSLSAEIWEDFVLDNGNKIQLAKTVEINLHRPGHVMIKVATVQPERTYFYNGKSVTYVDQRSGFFGIAPAPATIDKALVEMERTYGLTFPLDDLLMSNPYLESAAKAGSGQYLGTEMILGKECHHLAFQHEHIDWQAWIQEGPAPLIRKIVITHKQEPGFPQYTAIFKTLDLLTDLSDYLLNLEITSGFVQVDMLEVTPEKESPASLQ